MKLVIILAAAGGAYYAHTVGYDLWTADGWHKLYDKLNGGCACGGSCGGCGAAALAGGAAAAGAAAMQPVNAVGVA